MIYEDFFIAVYIHECKSYCDTEFFNNLFSSDIGNAQVEIVDNSPDHHYAELLSQKIGWPVHWIEVSREDERTQFIRNVCESVNFLRDVFLQTNKKYFVILEADVVPPRNWLHSFMRHIHDADIIGGIYYMGFHPEHLFHEPGLLEETTCVLSGCTLYKREIIERFPFRWDSNNLNAFPDGHMSWDARHSGYRLANTSDIVCKHLTKIGSDSRGVEDIR